MRSMMYRTHGFWTSIQLVRRRGGLGGVPFHPSALQRLSSVCKHSRPPWNASGSEIRGCRTGAERLRHCSLPGPARSDSAVTPSGALPTSLGATEWAFPSVPSRPTPDHRAPSRGGASRLQPPRHALQVRSHSRRARPCCSARAHVRGAPIHHARGQCLQYHTATAGEQQRAAALSVGGGCRMWGGEGGVGPLDGSVQRR